MPLLSIENHLAPFFIDLYSQEGKIGPVWSKLFLKLEGIIENYLPWMLRLWVCRRLESILGYLSLINRKRKSGVKGRYSLPVVAATWISSNASKRESNFEVEEEEHNSKKTDSPTSPFFLRDPALKLPKLVLYPIIWITAVRLAKKQTNKRFFKFAVSARREIKVALQ